MADYEAAAIAWESAVGEEVDALLLAFGKDITFHIHGPVVRNAFHQAAPVFPTNVICKGRSIVNVSEQQTSLIGNLQAADVALLFSRAEMLRKFPLKAEGEWLNEEDEFSFESERYKVLKFHPSGRIKDHSSIVILLGKTILGAFRDS